MEQISDTQRRRRPQAQHEWLLPLSVEEKETFTSEADVKGLSMTQVCMKPSETRTIAASFEVFPVKNKHF